MKKTSALLSAGLLAACMQANAHEGAGFSIEADGYGCSISDKQIKRLQDGGWTGWVDTVMKIQMHNELKAGAAWDICMNFAMYIGNPLFDAPSGN